MYCNKCKNADICIDHRYEERLSGCTSGIPSRKVQTNADRIRNMSDEELADTIFESCTEYMGLDECICPDNSSIKEQKKACYKCVLEWLKSESEVK